MFHLFDLRIILNQGWDLREFHDTIHELRRGTALNIRSFFKSDWLVGLIVTLLFLFAYATSFGPLKSLEYVAYDSGVSASQMPADNRIVIIDIDDVSIDHIGRWPWPRSVIADMIDVLQQAKARLIGVDIFFSEKQQASKNSQTTLKLIQMMKNQGKTEEAAALEAELAANDEDTRLVMAAKNSGNVFMPMFFDPGEPLGRPDGELPSYISRMSIENISDERAEDARPIKSLKIHAPFDQLAEASAGLGFLNVVFDQDGVLRTEPLVVEYFGQFFPSMSLAMAARDLNLTMNDIRLNTGQSVEVGGLDITTDLEMRLYPAFHEISDASYKHFSFHEVLSGNIPASNFKDKIVLIGVTGTGLGETMITPVANYMSGVEYHANVLQSILDEAFFIQPSWTSIVELLLIILIGVYLSLALPRLGAMTGAIISVTLLIGLLALGFLMLTLSATWLQTITAATLLLIGHILLTTKQHFATEEAQGKMSADSAESNRMLGLSFQSQGMLDMAFDKFRKCPPEEETYQCLYNLALDFERKRQFNKATSVYEYIAEHSPNYKDIATRKDKMRDAGETMIFGGSNMGGAMSTLLVSGGEKPTLGRYEIVKELGKGAMGVVYLGKDPKINREVAIKTMALSQEFEEDELEEVKERFFREAETAGMLNHPNIVTMYDAGEEHDLAYIAMEFLDGVDLSPYTKKGKLLPPPAVLKICGKVAEALHYANSNKVVHRDIKPANIMLLKDKTIKVTDFGIARLTASSKTKTGVVLGTPSYMSPEQLAGKHVDGRSDLFSLGVMMYEMLCGTRPFNGDSMATLMFQIANEPHPDIREYCEVPDSVAELLDKMLAKDADSRVQTGAEVVRGIIGCLKDYQAARQGGK